MKIPTKWSIALLTLFAALKVFLFSAASPFFAPTDELSHYDNIYRYAHGDIPQKIVNIRKDSARQIVFFRSLENQSAPPPDNAAWYSMPFWADNVATGYPAFPQNVAAVTIAKNIELVQPPPYYILAGAWYRLGWGLGLRGGWLLYWLRFLDIPLFAGLVPTAYLLGVACYGRESWVPMGAAIFTVTVPQDIFYSLNNDCLPPLASGLALLAVIRLITASRPKLAAHIAAGLLVGLALLTKLSNLPLLLPVAILFAPHARKLGKNRAHVLSMAVFLFLAFLPLGLWMLWNHHNTGDWMNSADKAATLTWTRKSWGQIWDHPIFRGPGVTHFYWLTIANFWCGEGWWHGLRASPAWLDGLFVLLSTGLFVVVSVALVRRKLKDGGLYDFAFLSYVVSSVLSLLILSLLWDFGACFNPSRAEPFFVSGRLILGCLLPFVLVCMRGFEIISSRIGVRQRNLIFGALVAIILVGQTMPRIEQFKSAFNWYHLKVPGDPNILNQPF